MLRGKAFVQDLQYESATTYRRQAVYVGFTEQECAGTVQVSFAPGTTREQELAAIEAAFIAKLETEHGFVFEPGDTVEVDGL